MKRLFFIFALLIFASSAFSQNILHGVIRDSETDKPVAYANVYIKDTYVGTVSNDNGDFSLEIKKIPATVVVSYIGYKTEELLVNQNGEFHLNIELTPVVLQYESIVITAGDEDPAIGIMKKVIANKIMWKNRLKSYKAKAYTRSKVENDTSIVSISESVSLLYWDLTKGSREEFIAKRSGRRMPY